MSQGKIAGVVLAIACGVATGYSTFAPELQKQQLERHDTFSSTHKESEKPEQPLIISNEQTIGATVRDDIAQVKQAAPDRNIITSAWLWFNGRSAPPARIPETKAQDKDR